MSQRVETVAGRTCGGGETPEITTFFEDGRDRFSSRGVQTRYTAGGRGVRHRSRDALLAAARRALAPGEFELLPTASKPEASSPTFYSTDASGSTIDVLSLVDAASLRVVSTASSGGSSPSPAGAAARDRGSSDGRTRAAVAPITVEEL